jgi:hypothetical protein
MRQAKQSLFFVVLVPTLCVVLILLPIPGLKTGYLSAFRAVGNTVFARFWFWSDGSVTFLDLRAPDLRAQIDAATAGPLPLGLQLPPPSPVQDTMMIMVNRRTVGAFGLLPTSALVLGYWPTALFLALLLPTPMRWKRKGWAFVWGMVLIQLSIAIRLTLTIAENGFATDKPYALFELGPTGTALLKKVEQIAVHDPTASLAIGAVVWLIVALPDLLRWLFGERSPEPANKP